MIKVSNNKYTLYSDHSLTVKCHKVANRVNKYLNYYKDYSFSATKGDEPVFKFKAEQESDVLKLLRGNL